MITIAKILTAAWALTPIVCLIILSIQGKEQARLRNILHNVQRDTGCQSNRLKRIGYYTSEESWKHYQGELGEISNRFNALERYLKIEIKPIPEKNEYQKIS